MALQAPPGGGGGFEIKSESLEKLKALKMSLQREVAEAERERQATLRSNDELSIPLSLVDEYRDVRGRRGRQQQHQHDEQGGPSGEGAHHGDGDHDPHAAPHGDGEHAPAGGGKPAAGPTKTNAKQRDIDLLFEAQERERRGMEMHNQRLRHLIELRHSSTRRAEQQAEGEILRLKLRLSESTTTATQPNTSMQWMHALNQKIQTNISHLHKTIETQAEHDKLNLVRQYRVKMHELRKELNEELQTNYRGSQEWIDRNNVLTAEYDRATEALEAVTQGNVQLAQDNKELKILFRKQEEERHVIVKQVTAARRENRRLQEQVKVLEAETITLSKQADPSAQAGHQALRGGLPRSPLQGSAFPGGDMGQEARYLQLINRAKRQVEQERRMLKQVRSNHIDLLQERTEAEVFVRQCLQDVRRDIASASAAHTVTLQETRPITALDEYTAEHRASLLELLCSKERILSLLYSKAFPFKAPEDSDRTAVAPPQGGKQQDSEALLQHGAEMDMEHLWQQWQSWTDRKA